MKTLTVLALLALLALSTQANAISIYSDDQEHRQRELINERDWERSSDRRYIERLRYDDRSRERIEDDYVPNADDGYDAVDYFLMFE